MWARVNKITRIKIKSRKLPDGTIQLGCENKHAGEWYPFCNIYRSKKNWISDGWPGSLPTITAWKTRIQDLAMSIGIYHGQYLSLTFTQKSGIPNVEGILDSSQAPVLRIGETTFRDEDVFSCVHGSPSQHPPRRL